MLFLPECHAPIDYVYPSKRGIAVKPLTPLRGKQSTQEKVLAPGVTKSRKCPSTAFQGLERLRVCLPSPCQVAFRGEVMGRPGRTPGALGCTLWDCGRTTLSWFPVSSSAGCRSKAKVYFQDFCKNSWPCSNVACWYSSPVRLSDGSFKRQAPSVPGAGSSFAVALDDRPCATAGSPGEVSAAAAKDAEGEAERPPLLG